MASEPIDKSKLMAFVHGELDAVEARQLIARLEIDENLRREVERLSAMHASVAAFYAADEKDDRSGADFSLSSEQLEKIRERARREGRSHGWFNGLIWGGTAVAMAAAAFVLWLRPPELRTDVAMEIPPQKNTAGGIGTPEAHVGGMQLKEEREKTTDQLAKGMSGGGSAAPPPPMQQPPIEPALAQAQSVAAASKPQPKSKMTKDVSAMGGTILPSAPAAPAKKVARALHDEGLYSEEAAVPADRTPPPAAQTAAPSAAHEVQSEDSADMDAPSAEAEGASSEPPFFSTQVAKVQVDTGHLADQKSAFQYIRQTLTGQTQCVTRQGPSYVRLALKVQLSPKGEIQSLQVTPSDFASTEACLKARLSGRPELFKGSGAGLSIWLKLE